jgi:hypothetical protein
MGKDSSTLTSRLTDLPTPAVLRAKLCDCSREQTLLQRMLRVSVAVAEERLRLANERSAEVRADG